MSWVILTLLFGKLSRHQHDVSGQANGDAGAAAVSNGSSSTVANIAASGRGFWHLGFWGSSFSHFPLQ